MEVVAITMDFDFNFPACPTAPSTPKRMGGDYYHYFTPPTRPLSQFSDHRSNTSPAAVPFAWEEKPGVLNSLYKFPSEDAFSDDLIKFLRQNNKEKRKRTSSFSSLAGLTLSRSRRTQSFSHNGGWECPWEEKEEEERSVGDMNTNPKLVSSYSSLSSFSASNKGSRKWRFKDLFLFRSASDGRAMDRDPLKKYSAIIRKHDEDFRNSSLRQTIGSGSGSGSKRRGGVSAHELHYKVNRAVSNDLKKKTFLPYKQGILGRLAFNPTVHALSNGFGFSHKN